ncbi:hypothetical protein DB345_01995 [Spartobacteria bacterium LR76]|nr:hypothetical protein DB345_01995 [Spartobacteria bacterium LR76]
MRRGVVGLGRAARLYRRKGRVLQKEAKEAKGWPYAVMTGRRELTACAVMARRQLAWARWFGRDGLGDLGWPETAWQGGRRLLTLAEPGALCLP